MQPYFDACENALKDGIVEDADVLDAGMIFGTGFAPFLGGPLNYAKDRGTTAIVTRLKELARVHGERFEPHSGWSDL